MNNDRVEKVIELRAPRSRVWRAISNGKDFGAWFGLGAELELEGDFVPGAEITGKWIVDGKAVIEHFCTIAKVVPEQLLSFDWIPYELPPGEDVTKHPRTHVEFRLEELPHGTRLTVSESGFAKLPADKQYKRDENGRGWSVQAHAIAQHVLGRIPVVVDETIAKPLAEVREAIVDPARMTKYFISEGSGRIEAGANLEWSWRGIAAKTRVMVRQAEPEKIVFLWGDADPTQVEITLADEHGATKVHVVEFPFELSEESAVRANGQTQGWTHFCCCLKAYLEHGVDLRRRVS